MEPEDATPPMLVDEEAYRESMKLRYPLLYEETEKEKEAESP